MELVGYIGLFIGVISLLINLVILLRIKLLKDSTQSIKKEINYFQFNQQTQQLNLQKMFGEELSQLRENLVVNLSKTNDLMTREMMSFQHKIKQDLFQFKDLIQQELFKHFEILNRNLNENLDRINERVSMRLDEGFEKTNKTFNSLIERLSKIDEAQKKIESLSTNIISLQDVLTDKKSRGTFGEIQLKQILVSIFGENNQKVFELQKKLSNQKIVDAILHTPEPLGHICIDSKFPLENYKRMMNRDITQSERLEAEKSFKQDVKNHINAIREKYIINGETSDSAIMFIPAEAIFAEINAYHQDIIEYSQKSQVWLASPTTLMFLLTTVQIILRNVERDQYTSVIQEELNKLGIEFRRYKDRWDKLSKNIDQVSKNVKDLHTTSDKIERHFVSISKVEFTEEESTNLLELIDEEEN
jgi:DNA recombination protein RmuC